MRRRCRLPLIVPTFSATSAVAGAIAIGVPVAVVAAATGVTASLARHPSSGRAGGHGKPRPSETAVARPLGFREIRRGGTPAGVGHVSRAPRRRTCAVAPQARRRPTRCCDVNSGHARAGSRAVDQSNLRHRRIERLGCGLHMRWQRIELTALAENGHHAPRRAVCRAPCWGDAWAAGQVHMVDPRSLSVRLTACNVHSSCQSMPGPWCQCRRLFEIVVPDITVMPRATLERGPTL